MGPTPALYVQYICIVLYWKAGEIVFVDRYMPYIQTVSYWEFVSTVVRGRDSGLEAETKSEPQRIMLMNE